VDVYLFVIISHRNTAFDFSKEISGHVRDTARCFEDNVQEVEEDEDEKL
jgi:hypothetical protein